MERDTFDAAIDEILAFTSGDIRRALRAVLIESVLLEEKLQQMQRRPAEWLAQLSAGRVWSFSALLSLTRLF